MTQHDHSNLGHGSGATAAAIQSGGFLGLGLAGHTEVFGQVGFIGFLRAFADADKVFFADLNELNNSDAEGSALLFQNGDRLTVITAASGVEAGQIHAQHIHGFEDGRNTATPTLAQDDDRDGFIEVAEGAETYGPILLDLTSPAGAGAAGFPKPAGTSFLFAETYNLNDPANGALATLLDEAPLQNREIVLHGLSTLEGQGAGTANEVDGSAGFKLFLPIASGEIQLASSDEAALAAFVDSLDAFESEHSHAPDAGAGDDAGATPDDAGHGGTDHADTDDEESVMAGADDVSEEGSTDDAGSGGGNEPEQVAGHDHGDGTTGSSDGGTTTGATDGGSGGVDTFGSLTFAGFVRAFTQADDYYFADLNELNNSDAEGGALLLRNGDQLTVITAATGVEAGQLHAQHIHGFEDGRNAATPTLAQDDDRDGFIEVAEGAETYGPILLDLASPPGSGAAGFPLPSGNAFLFAQTYDLSNPVNGALATLLDEAPLENREIVLHGLSTLEGQGAGTANEVNGTAGFKLFLPIAAGEIQKASAGDALAGFVDTLDDFDAVTQAQINDLMLG
jgi:nitrogen fixation protein